MFSGGDIPPVASRASMIDFNEPYTTVSFARPTMAASSSSVMSMARLNVPGSLVLNVGALPDHQPTPCAPGLCNPSQLARFCVCRLPRFCE